MGRRLMFLATMIAFIVLALAQVLVPSVGWLVVVRFLLGVPLGSDISNGYSYVMDAMPRGEREVVGNRWQFMFAIGQVMTLAVIALFLFGGLPPELLWRVTLGLGAFPALVILLLRRNLPEAAVWLIRRGRFREAKRIAGEMYGDALPMLPDSDVAVLRRGPTAFLADIRRDPLRWRATIYGWIACFSQAGEFSTFGFYLPVLFVMVGVSGVLGTNLVSMAVYSVAAVAGWIGPKLTPRIGERGLGIAGFAIVLVSLLAAAAALYGGQTRLLPFLAAAMLWGHY
jgi:MFS family permease